MRLLVGVEAEIVAYHDMRHMSDAGLWNGWYDLAARRRARRRSLWIAPLPLVVSAGPCDHCLRGESSPPNGSAYVPHRRARGRGHGHARESIREERRSVGALLLRHVCER